MTGGQAIVQLARMLRMKQERLPTYRGSSDSFLRADIAALEFALNVMEAVQAEGRLAQYRPAGRARG